MKKRRLLSLALCGAMALTLTACGGGGEEEGFQLPDFDSENLTAAQSYAEEAMDYYEIQRDRKVLDGWVLISEDLPGVMEKEVGLSTGAQWSWDMDQATAAVVIRLAEDPEEGEEVTQEGERARVVLLLNEEQDVVYKKVFGHPGGNVASAAATPESEALGTDLRSVLLDLQKEELRELEAAGGSDEAVEALLALHEEELVEFEATGGVEGRDLTAGLDSDDPLSSKKAPLRQDVARTELALETFVAEKGEAAVAVQTLVEQRMAEDPGYLWSEQYWTDAAGNSLLQQYCALREKVWNARTILDTLEPVTDSEVWSDTYDRLFADEDLREERREMCQNLMKARTNLEQIAKENAKALEPLLAQADSLKSDPNWMDREEYLRLCLQNEVMNEYDVAHRQLLLYEKGVSLLDRCLKTPDLEEREYLAALANAENENMPVYVNARKTAVQCLLNQEQFLSENAQVLADYEAQLAAAREAAQGDYKNDIGYMKVEMKYEDLTESKGAHEYAVRESKNAADEAKAAWDKAVANVEDEEADRQAQVNIKLEQQAFWNYVEQMEVPTLSEYEAVEQWGLLHSDYAGWQNQHLNYYTPPKPSSSGGGYSGGSSGGGYDYDKGYGYTAPKPGESFSDYVKRQDPDLYNSMKDIYNSLS